MNLTNLMNFVCLYLLVTRYSLLVTLSVVALLDKQQEIFIFKNSLHSDKLYLIQHMDDFFQQEKEIWKKEKSHSCGPDAPLATRMRPRTLQEYVGQAHLLSKGSLLSSIGG